MSINRVQKLLFSEYCDFEDMVLIESPFAQTTRDGQGIRQVHLGLTPTKLILATDVLPPVEKSCTTYFPGIDPDIETFELIAIYPVECVNLTIFRRRKRQSLKAHFCNNRVYYFELGGFENRNMFWNLWCEKVKFLNPEDPNFSHSETSVITSTTNSTLYLLDSKEVVKPNGLKQVWCKFGIGKSDSNLVKKWTDRNLYLGKNFDELPQNYKPVMSKPQIYQFLEPRSKFDKSNSATNSIINELQKRNSIQINRFGSGIHEGCSTGLFLPADDCIFPKRFSQISNQSSDFYSPPIIYNNRVVNYFELAECCVRLWEIHKENNPNRSRMKHRRRYGFAPQPLFLHGLGPWNVTPGARYSIQTKRAVSAVTIRRQPLESEFRLSVSRRQLIATVSCEALNLDFNEYSRTNHITNSPRKPVVFFWTPDFWYRPRSAKDVYTELQNHLTRIKNYQENLAQKSKNLNKRSIFRRNKHHTKQILISDSEDENDDGKKLKKRKSKIRFNLFGNKTQDSYADADKKSKESNLDYLKRILRMDLTLSAWEFDSTSLAQQLTMIDRDLFLKISALELGVLIWQQSSKNAPNVAAIIAFSHRISCLVATEILNGPNEKNRARLLSRFINVASKCHSICNFHSCRTILIGLQSPAIYRLKSTWSYVRKKHATKYQLFEHLCRLYRDPRLLIYQKALIYSCRNTPCLPFIGDILSKLLDRIPNYKLNSIKENSTKKKDAESPSLTSAHQNISQSILSQEQNEDDIHSQGFFTRLLKSFNVWTLNSKNDTKHHHLISEGKSIKYPKIRTIKALCDYYKPLDCYEDNRKQCLVDTTNFLKHCQLKAIHYYFDVNNLVTDYLLKARYKEERENFYNSFRIEPPELK